MEPFVTYFLKVNGLLILFYASYYFFLRKETFFQSNRWFLLAGILSSLVLPLLTFTEVIWIDPEPIVYNDNTAFIPINDVNYSTDAEPFNWNIVILSAYAFISCILLFKLVIELLSFFKIIKSGNRTKNEKVILVETSENQNPFSFFNYLVFNKVNFTEEELHLILIHEKVHIQQKHSIDVLISKFLCLVLWINPIVWLYRKAILENLEFIADSETSKISNKTYEYQKTLVKAVVCNNQLSITNQFYQSLIKKRIVMLNTNPSHQKNIWKYSIVIPALVAFVFLFQIKTIAQVKDVKIASYTVEVVQFLITKHTTDTEIKNETDRLKKEHGINLKISKIKRNSSNEIIGLSISYKDKEGNTGQLSKKSDAPIEPILFYKELDKKGKIGFGDQQMTAFATGIAWDQAVQNLETIDIKSEDGEDIYIINGKQFSNQELKDKIVTVDGSIDSKEDVKTNKRIMVFNGNSTISEKEPKTIIFLNENEISKEEMDNLDPEIIKSVNVNKENLKREIKIITKNSASIPEDAEIYINGKKVSKAELDELDTNEIALMNIRKENSKNIIEIQKKDKKTIPGGTWEDVEIELKKFGNSDDKTEKIIWIEEKANKAELGKIKGELAKEKAEFAKQRAELAKERAELARTKQPKIIETADGDQIILFNTNMLKIPGEPTTRIENGKVDVYVNGKKLSNPETFLTMDHSKIYYLEVTDKETLKNNVIKVKRIDVKTK